MLTPSPLASDRLSDTSPSLADSRETPWNVLLRGFLDFVFPPYCVVCEQRLDTRREPVVCSACWERVRPIQRPTCERCDQTLGRDSVVCDNCLIWAYSFSCIRTVAQFGGVVQELVHLMKYEGKRSIGTHIGEMIAARLAGDAAAVKADMLVAVPLHPSRERERGYNQSALIARAAGRSLGIPVADGILRRVRNTKTQTGLSATERADNVAGAFAAGDSGSIVGLRIALVDDVVTTGATADSCARALLEAGAAGVSLLAFAYAPRRRQAGQADIA